MSKWTSLRLFNFNLQKHPLMLENIFPFLIINAQKGIDQPDLDAHPSLCYFDFNSKDPISQIDLTDLPSETLKLLASEFNMIRGHQSMPTTPVNSEEDFLFCHEMVMVLRRQMLAYLAPVPFCLKAIDTETNPNYSIPDIFDRNLFKSIGKQLFLFESDRFCDLFMESAMLIQFLDHSFQILNHKYRLNQPIPDKRLPLSLFLKAMVNIFEVMPTIKLKSKSFFRFESRMIYSSIAFSKDEDKRFRSLLEVKKTVNFSFEELFDFYFTRESDLKASQFLLMSGWSGTSGSLPDVSVKSYKSQLSHKSTQPFRVENTFGNDYFRVFREDKLRNLNEKEDVEIENDFDNATDIF